MSRWMWALAGAQVLALTALVVFWVMRSTQPNPFDRLMDVTAAQGGLVATDLLGPGPLEAGKQLCLAKAAPAGTVCSRDASREAIARRLEAAHRARCRGVTVRDATEGAIEVDVQCRTATFTVAFEPGRDGLLGRPEAVWPGFAAQGFAKGKSGVWSEREHP